jgi:hypothetical protein
MTTSQLIVFAVILTAALAGSPYFNTDMESRRKYETGRKYDASGN